jgi:putative transposase
MLEKDNPQITLASQCKLIGLARSTAYYEPHRDPERAESELQLLRRIDELYTAHPHLGRLKMAASLKLENIKVNPKRVRRLMKKLGLQAVYPRAGKRTSAPDKRHPKYPYLLSGLEITAPDQVWATDITYIRLRHGFVYLVAILDWYSRHVISWELSNTLDASFCVSALKAALATGRRPAIFNSDQGSQFTSEEFTSVLVEAGISISMDGAGRAFDNIMAERLWRTVKYEEVYLRDYETPAEARWHLGNYFVYYNESRPHQSLDGKTPARVYGATARTMIQGTPGKNLTPGVGLGSLNKINRVSGRSADRLAGLPAPVALRAPYAGRPRQQLQESSTP